jgi:hypothetical protein
VKKDRRSLAGPVLAPNRGGLDLFQLYGKAPGADRRRFAHRCGLHREIPNLAQASFNRNPAGRRRTPRLGRIRAHAPWVPFASRRRGKSRRCPVPFVSAGWFGPIRSSSIERCRRSARPCGSRARRPVLRPRLSARVDDHGHQDPDADRRAAEYAAGTIAQSARLRGCGRRNVRVDFEHGHRASDHAASDEPAAGFVDGQPIDDLYRCVGRTFGIDDARTGKPDGIQRSAKLSSHSTEVCRRRRGGRSSGAGTNRHERRVPARRLDLQPADLLKRHSDTIEFPVLAVAQLDADDPRRARER